MNNVLRPIETSEPTISKHDATINSSVVPEKELSKSSTNIIITDDWSRKELIGRGAQAHVYRAIENTTNLEFAVKQVNIRDLQKSELLTLQREMDLLRDLDHPNIIKYLGTQEDRYSLNMFLEYAHSGSLASLVKDTGPLCEKIAKRFTKQLCRGIRYLHRNGITHRDIKGANVLLFDKQKTIKVADFGTSKRIGNASCATGLKGSPNFMAPEVITETLTDDSRWYKADVWSIGCTVYEILVGHAPWSEFSNPLAAMFHIVSSERPPDIPKSLSSDALDFITTCLQHDPVSRPSVSELLKHPFLSKKKSNRRVLQPILLAESNYQLKTPRDLAVIDTNSTTSNNNQERNPSKSPNSTTQQMNSTGRIQQEKKPLTRPRRVATAPANRRHHPRSSVVVLPPLR